MSEIAQLLAHANQLRDEIIAEVKKGKLEKAALISIQDIIDKTYSMPKEYVSYHKPRRISDDKREQARQMMISINSR